MTKYFKIMRSIVSAFRAEPGSARSILRSLPATARGFAFARDWQKAAPQEPVGLQKLSAPADNPLRTYFNAHKTGRGIWKWDHYFDVYHEHFRKYVGREVSILEVGIYSGGSLNMWKTYFGPGCTVYGVDIEPGCKCYEEEGVSVFIGDQADRSFWRKLKEQVPKVDIVIDDGGHAPEQQIVTLEEMLPHLRPGGVYLCEDVHGIHHDFAAYVSGLASHFHCMDQTTGRIVAAAPTHFQQEITGIHLHPYLVVVQKAEERVRQFVCPHQGTEWQPFAVQTFQAGKMPDRPLAQ